MALDRLWAAPEGSDFLDLWEVAMVYNRVPYGAVSIAQHTSGNGVQ